ncbi:MAG: ABC transporter permease subunit [Planctomycetota bacterium]
MTPGDASHRRPTSRRVLLADRAAEAIITIGGLGVLAAVLGMCVYLAAVVAPLFGGARVAEPRVAESTMFDRVLSIDEFGDAMLTLADGGLILAVTPTTGMEIARFEPPAEGVTAVSEPSIDDLVAMGFADGRVSIGTAGFASGVISSSSAADGDAGLAIGVPTVKLGGVNTPVDASRVRRTTAAVELGVPQDVGLLGAITHVDYREGSLGRRVLLARDAEGNTTLRVVAQRRGLGGGPGRLRVLSSESFRVDDRDRAPDWLLAMREGEQVLAIWRDGVVLRFGQVPGEDAWGRRASRTVVEGGVELTSATVALGGRSVLLGASDGSVRMHNVARDPISDAGDGLRLIESRRLAMTPGPVRAMALARLDRLVLACDDAGHATISHLTSGKRVARVSSAIGSQTIGCGVSPRGDRAVLVSTDASGARMTVFGVEAAHPEASWSALFGSKLYEGEVEPAFVYQSSSASDDSELKMSLVPLVFGTIKATVFALLFAAPIAVLAAMYSSEFLKPEVRRFVKPTVEMMASLPSVVLGFVAAVLVAPFMRDQLAAVFIGLALLPVAIRLGAHGWQLLPGSWRRFGDTGTRRLGIVGALALLVVAALGVIGPLVESSLFRPTRGDLLLLAGSVEPAPEASVPAWVGFRDALGPDEQRRLRASGLGFDDGRVVWPIEPATDLARDRLEAMIQDDGLDQASFRRWLDGSIGGAWPGWFLLLTPVGWLVVWMVERRVPLWHAGLVSDRALALADLGRFTAVLLAGVVLAAAAASAMAAGGLDPRDSIFGPFSQRNALVVGIIMGFAVIPLIYTLADDAMASVPDSLRSASLGAGATRWQTALRVVAPVAGSGIFSAVMIGLGRAVGETMIVLMATGNTPVMDWNVFGGLRTLAANIAVELPEAPAGGTHYRVLFLCGLTLFALTFVINTTAEVVRQRFRKRSAAL